MAKYKHRVVQGISELIEKYGGGGEDPIMRSVWWGIRGQVPSFLQALDENEEAIAEIEKKLYEVLDIKEPETKELVISPADKSLVVEPKPKQKRRKKAAEKIAEAEAVVEPVEE